MASKISESVSCNSSSSNFSGSLFSGKAVLDRKKILFSFLWACCISFFLMLFLTRSSFLYPYNNWDDSNSYFTMGKSMFHGILIYRDIFDQKGPYLYFLYGLCSLLSPTTFRGVFVMEVLFGAADLLLIKKTLEIWCSPRSARFLSPVLFACMCASKSFYWGGCAEELCLPFLLFPLYLLFRTLHKGRGASLFLAEAKSAKAVLPNAAAGASAPILRFENDISMPLSSFSPRSVFLAGLCCGFVFCVKFTLMGFFLGFALLVILTCRSLREFARLAGWFLLGTLLPFVPWVLYFAVTGGLADWYRVYIYTNVFLYSDFGANSHGATAGQKIYDLAKILYWLIHDNFQYFFFLLAGLVWMLLRRGASLAERIAPVVMFCLTFLFIYIGGAHLPYYALPLAVFAVTGMAGAGVLLDRIRAHFIPTAPSKIIGSAAALLISLGISFAAIFRCSWNMEYLGTPKDDIFLTRFTEDINRDRATGIVDPDRTTLLNIGCLDSGLYTTTGIYPSCYWFQTQTLPGGEVDREQLSYIREARTDYIVARDSYPEEIFEHYELIDQFHQDLQPQAFDYYLFRRIKN